MTSTSQPDHAWALFLVDIMNTLTHESKNNREAPGFITNLQLARTMETAYPTQLQALEIYWRLPEKTVRRKDIFKCGDWVIHRHVTGTEFEAVPFEDYVRDVALQRLGRHDDQVEIVVQERPVHPLGPQEQASNRLNYWNDWLHALVSHADAETLGQATPFTGRMQPRRM